MSAETVIDRYGTEGRLFGLVRAERCRRSRHGGECAHLSGRQVGKVRAESDACAREEGAPDFFPPAVEHRKVGGYPVSASRGNGSRETRTREARRHEPRNERIIHDTVSHGHLTTTAIHVSSLSLLLSWKEVVLRDVGMTMRCHATKRAHPILFR